MRGNKSVLKTRRARNVANIAKHRFVRTCSFWISKGVRFHVSHPYRCVDLTFELNILTLVRRVRIEELAWPTFLTFLSKELQILVDCPCAFSFLAQAAINSTYAFFLRCIRSHVT